VNEQTIETVRGSSGSVYEYVLGVCEDVMRSVRAREYVQDGELDELAATIGEE
jgi:hypothetical protein